MTGQSIEADSDFTSLTSVAEAKHLMQLMFGIVSKVETVVLTELHGRILAQDVVSERDFPAFTNAALDGYAVCTEDLNKDAENQLQIVAQVFAGDSKTYHLTAGQAIRILTGALMPSNANVVVAQELVTVVDGQLFLPADLRLEKNYREQGEDTRVGQVVFKQGKLLSAFDIGKLAALGVESCDVYRRLKVALCSTGDEIIEPGAEADPGSVYDANRFMLMSLLAQLGVEVTDLGILKDNNLDLREAISQAANRHQVIICSGGASTGDADFIAQIIKELGDLCFWRIAAKPGRPLAVGRVDDTCIIGFPGNPVAVAACFCMLAKPLLLSLGGAGWKEPHRLKLPAGFSIKSKLGRTEWIRAQLQKTDGVQHVTRYNRQGSGILSSLTESDGFVEVSAGTKGVQKGDMIDFIPFEQFGVCNA